MKTENRISDESMRIECIPYHPAAFFSVSMAFRNDHHTIIASPPGELNVLATDEGASKSPINLSGKIQ